jgi:hypothetical protein
MIAPPQRGGRNRIWRTLETGVLDHKSLIKDTTWLVCMNIYNVYTLIACSVCLNVLCWHQIVDFPISHHQAPWCFN